MAELRALAERHDVGGRAAFGPGKLVEELFEALVRSTLVGADVRPRLSRSRPRR